MPRWFESRTLEIPCAKCGIPTKVSKARIDRPRFCSQACFRASESFRPGNRKGIKQSPETIAKRVAKNRGRKRSGQALENIRKASRDPANHRYGPDHPNWRPGSSERRAIKRTCHGFIWNAIGRMPTYMADEIIPELGWSARQLREHLEPLLEPGMSWDNHGVRGWHIDHIRPISSFPEGTPVSVINELTNLRPLWWRENLSKGGKWDDNSGNIQETV